MKIKNVEENSELADKGKGYLVKYTSVMLATLIIAGAVAHVPWLASGYVDTKSFNTYKAMTHTRISDVYSVDFYVNEEKNQLVCSYPEEYVVSENEAFKFVKVVSMSKEKNGNFFVSDYATIYNSFLFEKEDYELVELVIKEEDSISNNEFIKNYELYFLNEDEEIHIISSAPYGRQVFGIYKNNNEKKLSFK